MLLANTSVARIVANGLPEQSLLRRHEAPLERRIVGTYHEDPGKLAHLITGGLRETCGQVGLYL